MRDSKALVGRAEIGEIHMRDDRPHLANRARRTGLMPSRDTPAPVAASLNALADAA